MNAQLPNVLVAAISGTAYLGMCLGIWLRVRARDLGAARFATKQGEGDVAALLVAHASQTGTAESIATQSAAALQTAGVNVTLCPFTRLDAARLKTATDALFIVSTYGEGDAPDAAARFVADTMPNVALDLGHLRYGLLALGDSHYRSYCGFGNALDTWLQQRGAQPIFPRIQADNGDPGALQAWRHELGHIAATTDLPEWQDVPFEPWTLRRREHLNPGSLGAPVFHIELVREEATGHDWQAGDLLQVLVPDDAGRPRDYSISSIPADGAVHLLVRLQSRTDGRTGCASGLLARDLPVGAQLRARLREHSQFRIGDNSARDLILIGNGTGIAGLRAHLKQRALERAGGGPLLQHWLVFGERQAAYDSLYGAELESWRAAGLLTRVDLVYSRDGGADRYVQDRLHAQGERLREWVRAGAAIYVCGSLEGMAEGVAAVLNEQLGESVLSQLQKDGRYRRDVY